MKAKEIDVKTKSNSFKGKKRKNQNSKDKFNNDKFVKGKFENDPSWYISTEQLIKDTASFSYAYPVGAKLDVGTWGGDINKSSVPGIFAIKTAITYGYTDTMASPINVAARKMYTYIRHANSGRANYDTPDLMIYLAAMDQAFAYLSWMRRCYGIMSTYNSQNRYFAEAAVLAGGGDYSDLIGNLADFRAYINTYALKISSMCIPGDIGFINKHMWMYEGMYLDKELDKAQVYMFYPDSTQWRAFGLYEDAGALIGLYDSNNGNECNVHDTWGLKSIISHGNRIIEPILAEQDFAIMSGDILKAYGEDKVYKAYGIDEVYSVIPVYDSLVLDQIQNLTLLGCIVWDESVNGSAVALKQGPSTVPPFLPKGNLISTPKFKHPYGFGASVSDVGANIWLCDRLVTFENNSPQPFQMLEATRMCNIADSYDLTTDKYTVKTIGSEVALTAFIWQFGITSGEISEWKAIPIGPLRVGMTQVINYDSVNNTINPSEVVNTLQDNHKLVQAVSQFSRHPLISLTSGVIDPDENVVHYGVVNGMLFELDNYTYVTKENLMQITEQALLGELRSQQFG